MKTNPKGKRLKTEFSKYKATGKPEEVKETPVDKERFIISNYKFPKVNSSLNDSNSLDFPVGVYCDICGQTNDMVGYKREDTSTCLGCSKSFLTTEEIEMDNKDNRELKLAYHEYMVEFLKKEIEKDE